ncbi:Holliday junction resolvase RuvX [Candidatus Uhrbacteria bacterium CG_4_10_14_0_2_um_filter_41_7]|uniref:Putative pre-16S rRNA nuclease n=1 Tax=Candidatus Uhrbacteria bacterium CG_4_9_14_3_um_filter_41_35 TaxID=1975034 RepID=A0A2M7XG03_9BACT|nr:MAG: Holliday junction resolvase RuvX [Candidatus Uhrbacteria bacterium CG11_big_fil_rev_8_21_14_0_20_41_9]PIZ55480.1 MAG: Holliday junction resolvase RuvX [Candidatus Uhrbacteria bacterium CG_4_10_14_0_2_um_filter_41_7]PJA46820.1 MAG: Holliday junction resolvase RuvX [Candidatus Uhrbacteria bacterium CG_4_9_14_3_um_filter_41_35]
MRYIGIDFGLRKIGIALGDSETKVAMPVEVLYLKKTKGQEGVEGVNEVLKLINAEGVDEVVVGVPLKSGDYSSDQLDITKKFIENLRVASGVVVHEVDERFTSAESQRLKSEYGAEAEEDALSAMLILQSYFDNN